MIDALLMKQGRHVSISIGDSGSSYKGTWKLGGETGAVTYCLVDAGHALIPIKVPGPEIAESISMAGHRLIIGTEVFEKTTSLIPESIQYLCPCDQQ